MKYDLRHCLSGWSLLLFFVFFFQPMILKSESLQSPKAYFGFQPGSDKRLINYEQLIAYFLC